MPTKGPIIGIRVYTDGGCKPNPGQGAIGVVITDEDGKILKEHGESIGDSTNNTAEYKALLKGLDLATTHTTEAVEAFSDSRLVVNQVTGAF